MTQKYRTTKTDKTYRKIWTEHFGPIPFDEDGRRCEIHHMDGDSSNNDISNLICLTIDEHYEIHYWQEDWAACLTMTKRMKITPEEKSELARKSMLNRMAKPGFVNNFAKRPDGTSVASDKVKDGTWHLAGIDTSGKNNGRYDATEYIFENIKTGERATMPQNDFAKTYGLSRENINAIVRKRRKTHKGWRVVFE